MKKPAPPLLSFLLASALLPSLASAQLRISEFQADNLDKLEDEDDQTSDWIEIHNIGSETVDLKDWALTDNADNLSKWTFPAGLSLAPDAYLVVFASEKNKHTPQSIFEKGPIKFTHTNFKLALEGEYLALVQPDGETIEHEFSPSYPTQIGNTSYGLNAEGEAVFYTEVTPGEANVGGLTSIGPIIDEVTNLTGMPNLEEQSEVAIAATVRSTGEPIESVTLFYRHMFRTEASTPMLDDGVAPDVEAGDGIFTGKFSLTSIFGTLIEPGQMIRWRVEASDTSGQTQRLPLFHDPLDSDEYFGTIAHKDGLEDSNLPILHWFIESPNAANTDRGARCAVFYEGEFYDNVVFDIHGQSTRGFPKKSYDADFNSGHRFLYKEGEDRVKDINILTNWADKSKIRNTIAYGVQAEAGVPAHYAFPIRIQQNGEFHSTADMVEDGDDLYLKRAGLRPDGALYKIYNTFDTAGGAEKKSRKWEDDRDLEEFIDGLKTGSREEKKIFTYDHVNIPDMVNFMAAKAIYNNTDFGHKNYYAYRDTGGTDEWTFLPWDVDLSLGRRWTSSETYFRDAMEAQNSVTLGTHNRLVSTLMGNPDFTTMFYRRLRTLMDRFYGEPGGQPDEPWFEEKIAELAHGIDPEGVVSDAELDYEKWGSWGNRNNMEAGLARVRDEFIPQRRAYLYGIAQVPNRQKDKPGVGFDRVVFRTDSGNPNEEYLVLRNRSGSPVDLSEWTISGAISYTLRPGTVIPDSASIFSPEGGELYIVRDSKAFRAREESPKGGEGLLLQGDYRGQLSARGETLVLKDRLGNVIAEHDYVGEPSSTQAQLRITEIMYRPVVEDGASPAFDAGDYEFLELKNIGDQPLDLGGAYFSDGVGHTFAQDATLAPGAYGLLVRNEAAFRSRYGDELEVLGQYTGGLNNGGERIELRDAHGENILSFEYDGAWSNLADDEGHSLVIVDEAGNFDSWKLEESWGASQEIQGSPGQSNQPITDEPDGGGDGEPAGYDAWLAVHFDEAQQADVNVSGPHADANGDGMSNLLAYGLGHGPMDPIDLAQLPQLADAGDILHYHRRAKAADLHFALERSTDLITWTELGDAEEVTTPSPLGDHLESVSVTLPADAEPSSYLRLRITLSP